MQIIIGAAFWRIFYNVKGNKQLRQLFPVTHNKIHNKMCT